MDFTIIAFRGYRVPGGYTEIKGVSMVKSPSGATLLRSENRKVSIEVPAPRRGAMSINRWQLACNIRHCSKAEIWQQNSPIKLLSAVRPKKGT